MAVVSAMVRDQFIKLSEEVQTLEMELAKFKGQNAGDPIHLL